MKKISLTMVTLISIGAIGVIYFSSKKTDDLKLVPQVSSGISTWKKYYNAEFGFSMKYPSQYIVKEDTVANNANWESRGLLTVLRWPGSLSQGMTPDFQIVSAKVSLQRQPVSLAQGKVYHTVAEYQKSGTAAKMIQGALGLNSALVLVNDVQALVYHIPSGDVSDISSDSYFFIKNDLIYHVSFNEDDPNAKIMLQSITLK